MFDVLFSVVIWGSSEWMSSSSVWFLIIFLIILSTIWLVAGSRIMSWTFPFFRNTFTSEPFKLFNKYFSTNIISMILTRKNRASCPVNFYNFVKRIASPISSGIVCRGSWMFSFSIIHLLTSASSVSSLLSSIFVPCGTPSFINFTAYVCLISLSHVCMI